MRITYLHQYFNTPGMSGGTRSYEMARRLVEMGHEVNMVTSWREPDRTEHQKNQQGNTQVEEKQSKPWRLLMKSQDLRINIYSTKKKQGNNLEGISSPYKINHRIMGQQAYTTCPSRELMP